jgi:predicted amidohydrolase
MQNSNTIFSSYLVYGQAHSYDLNLYFSKFVAIDIPFVNVIAENTIQLENKIL